MQYLEVRRLFKRVFSTYVLASHTLADDFSVFVDENVGFGAGGVDSTGGHREDTGVEGGLRKHLL